MTIMQDLEEKVDLFFQDPNMSIPQPQPGQTVQIGVLHLLRRDVLLCLEAQAWIPAAMAILAGIDLLGKFLAGDDAGGKVSQRFKCFVKLYLTNLHPHEAEGLYQLRNALMHSFGLYSKGGKPPKQYFFVLNPGAGGRRDKGSVMEHYSGDQYFVGVSSLRDAFELAVAKYKTDLQARPDLQTKFEDMWPYYGSQTLALEPPLQ